MMLLFFFFGLMCLWILDGVTFGMHSTLIYYSIGLFISLPLKHWNVGDVLEGTAIAFNSQLIVKIESLLLKWHYTLKFGVEKIYFWEVIMDGFFKIDFVKIFFSNWKLVAQMTLYLEIQSRKILFLRSYYGGIFQNWFC